MCLTDCLNAYTLVGGKGAFFGRLGGGRLFEMNGRIVCEDAVVKCGGKYALERTGDHGDLGGGGTGETVHEFLQLDRADGAEHALSENWQDMDVERGAVGFCL
ncbi:MAG: hypothetical protein IJE08_11715 [Clostridia bacterium]|nr:hypothetical protein [Clostridia bacterium]